VTGEHEGLARGERVVVLRDGPLRGARGAVETVKRTYSPRTWAWVYTVRLDDPPACAGKWNLTNFGEHEVAPLGVVEWLAELADPSGAPPAIP